MKITIDRQRCVGAGNCVMAADAVFEQNEADGLVELLLSNPPEHLLGYVREAELICPSGAIGLDENA
jgi:ferredoxin